MSGVVLQVVLGIEERDRRCLPTDHKQRCACNQMTRVKDFLFLALFSSLSSLSSLQSGSQASTQANVASSDGLYKVALSSQGFFQLFRVFSDLLGKAPSLTLRSGDKEKLLYGDILGAGSGGLHSSVVKLYLGDTASTGQDLTLPPWPTLSAHSQSSNGRRNPVRAAAVAGSPQPAAAYTADTALEARAPGAQRASRHPLRSAPAPPRPRLRTGRRRVGGRGGAGSRSPPFLRLARAATRRAVSRMRRGVAQRPPAPARQRRPLGPGQARGRRPEPR
ncbi:hypothetical protein ACRRTK_010767 [Alexandromys fortis]